MRINRKKIIVWAPAAVIILGTIIFLASGMFSATEPSELTFPAAHGEFVISVQARGFLEAKKAHTVFAPQINWSMTKIAWLPPEGEWVKKNDIIVELEAGEIERTYLNALSEVEIAKADAEKGKAELAMQHALLQSQLKTTEASLNSSKLQLQRMIFESPRNQEIRKLKIEQDEIELQKVQTKLVSNKKIAKEESARLKIKVKQAESKLSKAKHHLSQLQLKAPVDGFVEYARHWSGDKISVGTQLWPNMPVVKIPDLSAMQVKLQVGETEAQKLKKDQRAIIAIPSLQDLQLPGKVDQSRSGGQTGYERSQADQNQAG